MDIINIKKNDTLPELSVTLQLTDGTPIDLTNGSVWFNMANYNNYSAFFSGACLITFPSLGQCEYDWTGSIDTNTPGIYWGEFEISWGNGSRMTLPNDNSLKIIVNEDYN